MTVIPTAYSYTNTMKPCNRIPRSSQTWMPYKAFSDDAEKSVPWTDDADTSHFPSFAVRRLFPSLPVFLPVNCAYYAA